MFDRRYNLGEADLRDSSGRKLTLPTETWREYVVRRERCLDVREKLASGAVHSINDLITLNLDIRQFAQDVIATCEGPELLRAFYAAISSVTVLDPTCGSGAFLFAALNVLEPLYEACLDRMQAFLDDLERLDERPRAEKFSDFRRILDDVAHHPNRTYFILKSIIVNNLYGVDIMEEAVEICKLRLFLKLVAQIERVKDLEPLPDIDFNIRAGNTLVGFTSIAHVRRSVSGWLPYAQEEVNRILGQAEIVRKAFSRFHSLQTACTVPPGDFAGAKHDLRQRMESLVASLDRFLSKEYRVEPEQAAQYASWRRSHRPFHWVAEFFGIMTRGGFDAIIGNPPYVELRSSLPYRAVGYNCESAGNLYALILERSFDLTAERGRQGYIVPVSSVSTDRYSQLQRLLTSRPLVYASFDDRPSRLFEGLEHVRLAVHLIGPETGSPQLSSTRYNKWNAPERPDLFRRLRFASSRVGLVANSLPKLCSEIESDIADKVAAQTEPLSRFYSAQGVCSVVYSRKVGYFLQVLDFQPLVLDGQGRKRPPTEFKELRFAAPQNGSLALACLNSSLFYWLITAYSDCRHLNKREVDAFPVDLESLGARCETEQLVTLVARLMADLKAKSVQKRMAFAHDTLTVQCIMPKLSKPIIDEIDCVLARHYGFTDEELDFIINYDIKYRMGQEAEGDDGDEALTA
jgi:hypothetical protein